MHSTDDTPSKSDNVRPWECPEGSTAFDLPVGTVVGRCVGPAVGAVVGVTVGVVVGRSVGATVGPADGREVGSPVGAPVDTCWPQMSGRVTAMALDRQSLAKRLCFTCRPCCWSSTGRR